MGGGYGRRISTTAGQNPMSGVVLHYYLDGTQDSSKVTLKILDSNGDHIHTLSANSRDRASQLPMKKGLNYVSWNMRYADAETFPGMILWAGNIRGPFAAPGNYSARLIVGDDSTTVPFTIVKDPRSESTDADLQAQFNFLIEVRDKLTETHQTIKNIRDIRAQINDLMRRLGEEEGADEVISAGKEIVKKITFIEEQLYQTKNQSRQDPLNFPIRLNNKLAALAGVVASGDYRPTDQAIAVKDELTTQIDAQIAAFNTVMERDIVEFNELAHKYVVPAVFIK